MMMPGSTEFALAQTDNRTSTRPPTSGLAKVFTMETPYLTRTSVASEARSRPIGRVAHLVCRAKKCCQEQSCAACGELFGGSSDVQNFSFAVNQRNGKVQHFA